MPSRGMPATVSIASSAGTPVCERCVIADRPLTRLRGLLGRNRLAPGEGLLLTRTASVHTLLMRFAIDVLFLDSDLVVVGVVANVAPMRVTSCRRARAVLELAAGAAGGRGVVAGDRLVVGRRR